MRRNRIDAMDAPDFTQVAIASPAEFAVQVGILCRSLVDQGNDGALPSITKKIRLRLTIFVVDTLWLIILSSDIA